MRGIKGVESILQSLIMIALLATIEPYGNEREKSKTLLWEIKFLAEKGKHIIDNFYFLHPK